MRKIYLDPQTHKEPKKLLGNIFNESIRLLRIFKNIIIGRRIASARRDTGIVACHGEDLSRGRYKVKTFQTSYNASTYRLYCRWVAKTIVNGIERSFKHM
jgi:hypothetical protein